MSQSDAEKLQHALTLRFLSLATDSLRDDVFRFGNGVPLGELPNLQKAVAELFFIPVSERIQEGDHALVHRKGVLRHISAPFVSLSLRMPEIEETIWKDTSPEAHAFQQRLLRDIHRFSDSNVLAQYLGLLKHPRYAALLQGRVRNKEKLHCLTQLIYGMTLEQKYVPLQKQRKTREATEKGLKAMLAKVQSAQKQKVGGPADLVLRSCILHHIHMKCVAGKLYSLPSSALRILGFDFPLRSLGSAQISALASSSSPNVEDDFLPEDSSSAWLPAPGPTHTEADVWRQHTFFRIVRLNPSASKTVSSCAVAAKGLSCTDIAVTIHFVIGVRPGGAGSTPQPVVQTEPQSCLSSSVAALSIERADFKELVHHWSAWSGGSMYFYLEGRNCNTDEHQVLESLFQHGAMEGDSEAVSVDCTPAHETLAGQGYLELTPSPDSPEVYMCRFSEQGKSLLRVGQVLSVMKPLFVLPPLTSVTSETGTAWELLGWLEKEGWQMRKAPRKSARPALKPYTPDGVKAACLVLQQHATSDD